MKGWREEILSDVVTRIGRSILQHGKFNDRIYLMKLNHQDHPLIIGELNKLAVEKKYSKIFAKIPGYARKDFIEDQYVEEAHIPGFYNGLEDAYFMAKYLDSSRKEDPGHEINQKVLETALSSSRKDKGTEFSDVLECGICKKADVDHMVDIYKHVFETYPFPIHDPEYILETMDEDVIYFGIYDDGNLVSIASCEMDPDECNVEMTDFATLPEYRGRGFSTYILDIMEHEMQKRGMKTAYTIARACSYGMNIVFSRSGYDYSGTLINNTNISGDLESMNVWYKHL